MASGIERFKGFKGLLPCLFCLPYGLHCFGVAGKERGVGGAFRCGQLCFDVGLLLLQCCHLLFARLNLLFYLAALACQFLPLFVVVPSGRSFGSGGSRGCCGG